MFIPFCLISYDFTRYLLIVVNVELEPELDSPTAGLSHRHTLAPVPVLDLYCIGVSGTETAMILSSSSNEIREVFVTIRQKWHACGVLGCDLGRPGP